MRHAIGVAMFLLALSAVSAAQTSNPAPADNWTYPVIKDYGRAWPLPHAAVQPKKGKIYKVLFDLSKPSPNDTDVLPGLAHAARTLNVFASLGVPPGNMKIVAVFHGSAAYAAMNNDVYRAKYNRDNPNLELIHELKAAGVELYLCGQSLHELKFNEKDMLPEVKLATSAMVVLVTYQTDGYVLMPF